MNKKVIELAEIDNGYWVTVQHVNPDTRQIEKTERLAILTKEGVKRWLDINL